MNDTASPSRLTLGGMRPQDRRALAIGAIILAVLLGYSRIARPAFDRHTEQQRAVEEQRALLGREQALIAAAPSLPRAQREADKALAAETARLFRGDSVAATAELSAYVSRVAAESGVHLSTLDGRAPVTARDLVRLSVDVRGEATWLEVLTFVHRLEASSQLVDVSSLRVERGPRGGPLGGNTVNVAATLTGYSRGAR
jgi:type II secretory pathway component PulM